MNKNSRSENPLKPNAPFKWGFMDIIPSTAPKRLTSDTHFSHWILIVDAYSKIPKLYGMEKFFTEEVTDKMDMFQSKSGLEHIHLIRHFFCGNFLHTIIFWNFRVGINN